MKRNFLILFLAMIVLININNSVHASVLNVIEENAKDAATEAAEGNVDSIITGADDFIETGKKSNVDYINENALNLVSSDLYNVFFLLGTILAVIIGVVLGIQFVTSGVEGKAKVKEALIAYVIGCCVIFGSVAIWKVCINILGKI